MTRAELLKAIEICQAYTRVRALSHAPESRMTFALRTMGEAFESAEECMGEPGRMGYFRVPVQKELPDENQGVLSH